jgi:hypothetical protein
VKSTLLALSLLLVTACHRKHVAVDSVPELGYPQCAEPALPPVSLAAGQLRAGPGSLEHTAVERFEIRRENCLVIADGHQEWPLQSADVQVAYDARTLLPLRAWRRLTVPGAHRGPDIRRYEFRTPEITVKRRMPDGSVSYEHIRGAIPRVVIAPGRGLLTMWLKRVHLSVGGRVREPALDLRQPLEEPNDVTLHREPDMFVPWLGHMARVYTIYGRESVYADENDVVIGDLAGLRESAFVAGSAPPSLAPSDPPDPVNTP